MSEVQENLSIEVKRWEPPEAEFTLGDDAWRGYRLRLVLGGREGELSRVDVLRDNAAAPLNSWRLQQIPLAAMERALRAAVTKKAEEWGEFFPSVPLFSPDEWPSPEQRERSNRNDIKLAELARAYVETLGQPQQSRILAERLSYSPASIARLIRRARERDLLTATTKGSAGGELTPRARVLLGDVTPDQLEAWKTAQRDQRDQQLQQRMERVRVARQLQANREEEQK